MNISSLEAALKARIGVLTVPQCPEWRAIEELNKALTLISQLKQSVEAKRDEIQAKSSPALVCQNCGWIQYCSKECQEGFFEPEACVTVKTTKKLIDEIIGEGT